MSSLLYLPYAIVAKLNLKNKKGKVGISSPVDTARSSTKSGYRETHYSAEFSGRVDVGGALLLFY